MSSLFIFGLAIAVLILMLMLLVIAYFLLAPSKVDWRAGISDEELSIMRERAERKAHAQIEREATAKFRDLTRR